MGTLLALASVLLLQGPATGPLPQLKLEHLNRLTVQARNAVDVTMDAAMLQAAAAQVAASADADAVATTALVGRLERLSVRSFEFDRDGVYTDADVDAVRAQLGAPWTRTVNINTRADRRRVEAYRWREDDQPRGLVVVVAEPRRLIVAEIRGPVDLSQLAGLKGLAGISDVVGAVLGASGGQR